MEQRALIEDCVAELNTWQGPPVTFMEVCGTHTMAIARFGLRDLLPQTIRLISGPGCPVCVTPVAFVDHALALAALEQVTVATFGDMMRVPGSSKEDDPAPTLTLARARGADVRVVYSPADALDIAEADPHREVVFIGVGFETTAPALAATVLRAEARGLRNVSLLSAAKTIPEVMTLLAEADDLALDGFICPGHVSAVLGTDAYLPIAAHHELACAVAGFEPAEILRGLVSLTRQIKDKSFRVDNCYPGVVRREGNPRAREVMYSVFTPAAAEWRGIGLIDGSGLAIRSELAAFDAAKRFNVVLPPPEEPKGCRCGDILKGIINPLDCPLFGNLCTPEHPKGACMVSSEGSCAASFHYRLEDAQ
jgi:hydrogenase expression/formation protein HypD